MALLTTFCGKCEQIALTDQRHLLNGRLTCSRCGNNVLVPPGCSFAEEDRGLFDDLKQVVMESHVAAAEAKKLADHLANVLRSGSDHGLLEQLTSRLPGLLPVATAAGANRPARQRALKVLRAILETMAQAERMK